MEDNRKEQLEALEILVEFNERLLKNFKILVKELSGTRLEDTDRFIKGIVEAMNWEIAVLNGTLEVLNEGEERINKEEFNTRMVAVSDAIASKKDAEMAKAFEDAIPYFEKLGAAAKAVL